MLDDDVIHSASFTLKTDPSRTVIRPFMPEYPADFANQGYSHAQHIADRVSALTDEEVSYAVAQLIPTFSHRHRYLDEFLLRRFRSYAARSSEMRSRVIDRF